MGQAIYIADPVVAAQYKVHPGEFAWVKSDAEAAWLLTNRHGFSLKHPTALPKPYFVHSSAPLPFVPFGTAPAPSPQPAPMRAPPPAPPPAPSPESST